MARSRVGRWLSRVLSRWRRRPAIDPREARAVIEAYASCLERRLPRRFSPERDLPYSKEVIGRVILRALEAAHDERLVTPLRQGFVDLETFLGDDEWKLVEDDDGRPGGSPEAAVMTMMAEVEERKERRRRLLAILMRERAARATDATDDRRDLEGPFGD